MPTKESLASRRRAPFGAKALKGFVVPSEPSADWPARKAQGFPGREYSEVAYQFFLLGTPWDCVVCPRPHTILTLLHKRHSGESNPQLLTRHPGTTGAAWRRPAPPPCPRREHWQTSALNILHGLLILTYKIELKQVLTKAGEAMNKCIETIMLTG